MAQALEFKVSNVRNGNIALHPAWHGVLNASDANLLLENQALHTYLFRQDVQQNDLYWVSFVNQKGDVCHKPFTYQNSIQKWLYLNNGGVIPVEAKVFDHLSDMIHFHALRCSTKQSIPLVS